MSKKISKQIKTKYKKDELRGIVNKLITDIPALKSVVEKIEWQGDTLLFVSKIGDGYFALADYLVKVEINLNFVGSLAHDQIESVIDSEFLKLDSKKS